MSTSVWVTISTQELSAQTPVSFRVCILITYSLYYSTPESTALGGNHHSSLLIHHFSFGMKFRTAEVFGQLVVLGFDVTVFTPAPYQRHRL